MDTRLLPSVFPTAWASEWGEDEFGLYLDLDFQNVIQRFRWIAPGSFLMGSPETELERSANETQHAVTLTQGFWLADSACSQALWVTVMGKNPAYFQDSLDHPVEQVSWDEVQVMIRQLNALIPDLHARLPTEAEWEYACRAGTTTPFSFGETITPEQVNYDGSHPYADAEKGLARGKTVPVKSLPPNPWGLYEMHGNVWEWCADWYSEYPYATATDPIGFVGGTDRVLRGGSWYFNAGWTRSAFRRMDGSDRRYYGTGFRLVLDPGGVSSPEISG